MATWRFTSTNLVLRVGKSPWNHQAVFVQSFSAILGDNWPHSHAGMATDYRWPETELAARGGTQHNSGHVGRPSSQVVDHYRPLLRPSEISNPEKHIISWEIASLYMGFTQFCTTNWTCMGYDQWMKPFFLCHRCPSLNASRKTTTSTK